MKDVLIIGWYGTETIGDRGILAEILRVFNIIDKKINYTIASIYPFYTERTILEDTKFYIDYCNLNVETIQNIRIIDSRSLVQLKKAIKNSDYIILGGGPLDDMMCMHMIDFAFKYAKKNRKKTMVFGSGLNVLKKNEFKRVTRSIFKHSDVTVLRDYKSLQIAKELGVEKLEDVKVSIDPACFVAKIYRDKNDIYIGSGDCYVINLREFPAIYAMNEQINNTNLDDKLYKFMQTISKKEESLVLVAMNYFAVGNDDRDILNRVNILSDNRFTVINKPLSLQETFDVFLKAKRCIGMRFHSVVFQTILNGNNYIMNYTDPQKGKIPGFLEQIKGIDFYKNRNIDLQNCDNLVFNYNDNVFHIDEELLNDYHNIYINAVERLLCIE